MSLNIRNSVLTSTPFVTPPSCVYCGLRNGVMEDCTDRTRQRLRRAQKMGKVMTIRHTSRIHKSCRQTLPGKDVGQRVDDGDFFADDSDDDEVTTENVESWCGIYDSKGYCRKFRKYSLIVLSLIIFLIMFFTLSYPDLVNNSSTVQYSTTCRVAMLTVNPRFCCERVCDKMCGVPACTLGGASSCSNMLATFNAQSAASCYANSAACPATQSCCETNACCVQTCAPPINRGRDRASFVYTPTCTCSVFATVNPTCTVNCPLCYNVSRQLSFVDNMGKSQLKSLPDEEFLQAKSSMLALVASMPFNSTVPCHYNKQTAVISLTLPGYLTYNWIWSGLFLVTALCAVDVFTPLSCTKCCWKIVEDDWELQRTHLGPCQTLTWVVLIIPISIMTPLWIDGDVYQDSGLLLVIACMFLVSGLTPFYFWWPLLGRLLNSTLWFLTLVLPLAILLPWCEISPRAFTSTGASCPIWFWILFWIVPAITLVLIAKFGKSTAVAEIVGVAQGQEFNGVYGERERKRERERHTHIHTEGETMCVQSMIVCVITLFCF
jgi:hypothetical protein